jgi:hypothetical protein
MPARHVPGSDNLRYWVLDMHVGFACQLHACNRLGTFFDMRSGRAPTLCDQLRVSEHGGRSPVTRPGRTLVPSSHFPCNARRLRVGIASHAVTSSSRPEPFVRSSRKTPQNAIAAHSGDTEHRSHGLEGRYHGKHR